MRRLFLYLLIVPGLFGQGTSITTGVLVPLNSPAGYVPAFVNFDKVVQVGSRNCAAGNANYRTDGVTSEAQDALPCYSYADHRWYMLDHHGAFHTSHSSSTGHSWGHMFWESPTGLLHFIFASGSNSPDFNFDFSRFDVAGLTGLGQAPTTSIGGSLIRPWISGNVVYKSSGYDTFNGKAVHFPNYQGENVPGNGTVVNMSTMVATNATTANAPSGTLDEPAIVEDTVNHLMWIYDGTTLRSYNTATDTWTATTNTCTGADCTSGHPPTRIYAGLAFGLGKIYMVGGVTSLGGTAFSQIWSFNPSTFAWNEECASSCGWTESSISPAFNRFVFDGNSNVFLYFRVPSQVLAYAPTGSSPSNYGRNSPTYAAPQPTKSLNRTSPPSSATTAASQSWAFDVSASVSSLGDLLVAHAETAAPSATGNCIVPIPTVWSSSGGGTQLTGTTPAAACTAINGQNVSTYPTSRPFVADVGGTIWWAFEKHNLAGNSSNAQTWAGTYNSGTGAWGATAVGGFTASYSTINQFPVGLIPAGSTPTLAVLELDTQVGQRNINLWVAQNTGAWSTLGSSRLNRNNVSGTSVRGASIAATAANNVGAAWVEQVSSDRSTLATRPQTYVSVWNGSTWTSLGGSLNISATAWADGVSITNKGGTWFASHTEREQTGSVQKAYLQFWNGSTWVLAGSATINNNSTTGIAYHTSLNNDGTNVYCAFEEQDALGQPAKGRVVKWNGSTISPVGGAISMDVNGSVADISLAMVSAKPTVAFTELTWGSMRQVYAQQFNGTSWAALGAPSCAITTASLPGGTISSAYSQTVNTSGCSSPTFSVPSGSLPNGLTLNTSTGVISGTPLSQKVNPFTVSVADANGSPTQPLSITITGPALSVPLTAQEALYSGSAAGVSRSNDPMTMGVPIADSYGIVDLTTLGLTGASAGQFMCEATWPSGNCKWVKVRAVVSSIAGGSTASLTMSNSGSGNFGGSNLAADNGATITVATAAATFTIKKANFNFLDTVVVGSTTLVATGTSDGLVLLGPSVFSYPDNVTCSTDGANHAGISSVCSTPYKSSNDGASACAIEENGPAQAAIKCDGSLIDGAAHTYMKYTARLYFSASQSKVKATVTLRNADYGSSNTFFTAYKGFQGFDIRLTAKLAGTLSYTIANHTGTPTAGTLNGTVAADSCGGGGSAQCAYLYQAESSFLNPGVWCQQHDSSQWCVPGSSLNGYTILANGSQITSGTVSQAPQGWADISDAGGAGIEIGQPFLAGFANKSLEFRRGGTDVRIGIKASQNNSTSLTTLTPNTPYYLAYPQYEIDDVLLNFHATAPASLANEFLKQQHYLVGRADVNTYNASNALPYPLVDVGEENAFYSAAASAASPSVTAFTPQDFGTTDTFNFPLVAWRFYPWAAGGAPNQSDLRYSHVLNFIRRGFTGNLLDSMYWYRLLLQLGFPRADGFSWTSHPADTQYMDYYALTSHSQTSGTSDLIDLAQEHSHWYGMTDFYLMTGDETFRDALVTALPDWYLTTTSTNNLITNGHVTNARAAGTLLMGTARLATFLQSQGNSATAASILARGNTLWATQIKPDLCIKDSTNTSYPAGCVPDETGANGGANQRGTSKVRGVTFQWAEVSMDSTGCSPTFGAVRTTGTFMNGILAQGLWEYRQAQGPAYADYNSVFDLAYGLSQGMFGEMYIDNNTSSWSGNGFRYKAAIGFANACASTSGDFKNKNPDAWWPLFYIRNQYEGATFTGFTRKLTQEVQNVLSTGIHDELFQYVIGNLIYLNNHGSPNSLNTVPFTFTNNGGNSYTFQWAAPPGVQFYRMKWSTKNIVDYIGFDAGLNSFTGLPATTSNWWASADTLTIPAAGDNSITVTVAGQPSLVQANFMLKAMSAPAGSPSSIGSGIFTGIIR